MVGLNVSNLLESKAALIHLRTVRVTAAVYWALSLELLQTEFTPLFQFPAPGRCQTLYLVLPLCRVLCF